MAAVPAPTPVLAKAAAKPLALRLPFDGISASPRLAPVVDKTEKAEGSGFATIRPSLRAAKVDPLGLLRIDLQPIRGKPLRSYLHDPPSIRFQFAADEKIVGVAVKHHVASAMGFHYRLKPRVEHFVHVHVCE